uniref:Ribosomal protein L23 n=1 Tax=Pseudellipsoidion edaphicum TaxID=1431838 RepID=A0A410D2L2_9STRA|nr:ribosomal protein L23 [Pseudellipsoidion edaphicum]QAA11960.1 ribosomal protein L23 [Pseudellipsoidion edaphicum]
MINEKLQKVAEFEWIDILRYPLATEKATNTASKNYHTFIVDKKANKTLIKKAFEYVFNVKVVQIQTLTMPKKTKRRRQFEGQLAIYKKAIIRLSPEYNLDFFGMEKTSLGI